MSDFVSEFWNLWVVGLVTLSIAFCAWLLWSQSLHKPTVSAGGEVGTSGHVWDDDLQEYNHPLPKWWMWLFIITIVFSIVYLALFPGFGRFQGVLGWSSQKQYEDERAKVEAQVKPIYDKFAKMDLKAVAADKEAQEIGKRLFMTYCSQCHGSDGKGSKGFPNLTDNDWLWGGDPEQIKTTILDGRMGMMPPHAHLGAGPIEDVANYVRSLSGESNDSLKAAKGKEVFATAGCTGCHGPEAKGNPAMGAPNLTDKTWLHGKSKDTIVETISKGRQNKMPAWKEFLGEDKVHLLAAYVLSVSANAPKQ
jgi:cytochrome c oxidase cbb3-type subunit 3